MSRPVEYSEEIDARDMQLLTRVLKRVQSDPGRDERWRGRAVELLEELVIHFVKGRRKEHTSRANGQDRARRGQPGGGRPEGPSRGSQTLIPDRASGAEKKTNGARAASR